MPNVIWWLLEFLYENNFKVNLKYTTQEAYKNIIEKYTVYSQETANEMAKNIVKFANSNIGVGVTGELGNTTNREPKVYYSIYITDENKMISKVVDVNGTTRAEMKAYVANSIFADVLNLI